MTKGRKCMLCDISIIGDDTVEITNNKELCKDCADYTYKKIKIEKLIWELNE